MCSWSLQAESSDELVQRVRACGVDAVQLALEPLRSGAFDERATVDALARAGIAIRSGMMSTIGEDYSSLATIRTTGGVRADAHWQQNLANARVDAAIARRLGLHLVTFHAGFLPHEASDPERSVLIDRLRAIVDVFAEQGVRLGFETGQETAVTLLAVLRDLERPAAGVNFDPANMILYGMGDPIAALRQLAPHVLQVHVKDALASRTPGAWGEEVRAGTGQVDWTMFAAILRAEQPTIDWMIEREAGTDRSADIRAARALVTRLETERTGGAA